MNQTLALHANVMDRSGEPLPRRRRLGADHGPVGQGRSWSGSPRRATSGACSPAGSRRREPGKHEVTLFCKQTGATLETSFFVQGAAAERSGKPARPEVLEELARVTRGKVIEPDKLDEVSGRWPSCPSPRRRSAASRSGATRSWPPALIVLLGVFWVGRKVIGLSMM